jgi:hypothetical protein
MTSDALDISCWLVRKYQAARRTPCRGLSPDVEPTKMAASYSDPSQFCDTLQFVALSVALSPEISAFVQSAIRTPFVDEMETEDMKKLLEDLDVHALPLVTFEIAKEQ